MLGLQAKAWSPYVAGVIIGLLQIPAFLLIGTALGASSSYVTVVATLSQALDPVLAASDYATRHLSGAKNWWQVALVGGIVLGAFVSARISGARRAAVSPVWRQTLAVPEGRPVVWRRLPLAFAGGFLMLLGARIADGCTSGHGISGIAQLAVGSLVAVAAMFAGGMATALLFRRR